MPQHRKRAADMVKVQVRQHHQIDLTNAKLHQMINACAAFGTLGELDVRPSGVYKNGESALALANEYRVSVSNV